MMRIKKLFLPIIVLFWVLPFFSTLVKAQSSPTPTVVPTDALTDKKSDNSQERKIYVVEVSDAEENIDNITSDALSNTQRITLELLDGDKKGTRVETSFLFPSAQFKEPLKRGDKVIIESTGEITAQPKIVLLSKYRQNNLLVWSFILLGLFILVAGFKSNIKYFLIFLISVVSGVIVLYFYHKNTYLTLLGLTVWLVLSTTWFAFKIYKNRIPALVLTLCVLGNLLVSMIIVFIMVNIDLFDTGFFDVFFPGSIGARKILIYLFAILVVYPLSVVFGEQIVSESIKKKREENDILKINMIKHVSKSALKNLNNIFLTFFGLFYAIFVCVIAIASKNGVAFEVINSSALSQILSMGFLVLFNLLIFVPLISFISGMWLGMVESHELITDTNLRQLEL